MISKVLHKIMSEYPIASKQSVVGHPLRIWIENEARELIKETIDKKYDHLVVNSSAQFAGWLNAPWIAIMDKRITTSAKKGYYVSYSFAQNLKYVAIHIGQGHDELKNDFGKDWRQILKSRSLIAKKKLPEHKKIFTDNPSTMKNFRNDKKEIIGGHFGKIYYLNKLPSEDVLKKDLNEMISLHQKLYERGGVDRETENKTKQIKNKTWLEDIIQALHNIGGEGSRKDILTEIKRIRPELNPTWKNTVQKEIESHSSDSEVWQNKTIKQPDLFISVYGIGKGFWGLRSNQRFKNRKLTEEFENKVKKSINLSIKELRERINNSKASKKTTKVKIQSSHRRNPDVKALILKLAKGKCDLCTNFAPFMNKENLPYLEEHHIKWLSKGGDDLPSNCVALCPNCHRKMHSLDLESDVNKLKSRIKTRDS